ncbi:hypothetical protein F8R89_01195 [Streptomyces sp. SS1-1]|nr:hypothetical protein F8R89_01195 [Streptomyces sp. SS1-1]
MGTGQLIPARSSRGGPGEAGGCLANAGAFGQNADDPEGEDVRHASVGQLALTYWVNRHLHRLSVLTITWLG